MIRYVVCVLLLLACSSSTASSEPSSCPAEGTDRTGVYRFTFKTVSGNCGDIPEGLIDLTPNATGSNGCTVTSRTFGENNCKMTVDETCPVKGGGTLTETAVTREVAAGGATLSGTFTVDISGAGADDCVGTYDVTAVRQ